MHARQTQEMAVLRSRGDRGQDELKRAHQQVSVLLSAEEATRHALTDGTLWALWVWWDS